MMRVTTLKAAAAGVGGLLAYYAGLAEDRTRTGPSRGPVDYYLDPDEPAGRWWGQGQAGLGVEGEVEADQLRAVLEGRHPMSGVVLGRAFGDASARGFDATFSAPKSVSVLWALTPDPWVRAEVLAAHDRAVDAALDWFEQHGAVTRRGRDGIHQVDTRGVTAALFRQHTSRTVDPQLHTHALISSKVQDPTGRWLALDARLLKYQQRTIGWVYDAALRSELTDRLGVEWGDVTGGQAELTSIPADVRGAFSQRSAQVAAERDRLLRAWADRHDGREPDRLTIARLERAAVLASRPPKQHGLDSADLHATWRTHAEALGMRIHGLSHPSLQADQVRPASPVDDAAVAKEALRRVAEESSTWLVADVARHIATLLPPDAAPTASALVERIDRIAALAAERCIELSPEQTGPTRQDGRPVLEHVTDRRLTTREVLGQEQRLQDWARTYAERPASTPDRQAAASDAIAGTASLVIVVGPAGTGKTRTTAQAVDALYQQGRTVVGLAPAGKAADVLRAEAGCPTDTLAGFLTRHRDRPSDSPWPVGTTVILDEAGMAATGDLAQLVALVRRNHWRLVVVGDPAQLPSVGRGGVFAHWCSTVPHYELDTPRRFHEPWEAEASLALRIGDARAVSQYDDHGRLHVAHPVLLAERIADEHQRAVAAGRTVAITTSSRDTARAINEAIQARQGRHPDEPTVRTRDGTDLYAGDVVATRRNDSALVTDQGAPVRNRQTWTVEEIAADGSIVLHSPERGRASIPAGYAAQHVELGWATTGYGTQGDTVDIGMAVVEPGTNRSHAYVAMTRGREANHAWIPDPTGEHDPADALEAALGRSDDRTSALATLDRLHQPAHRSTPVLEPPQLTGPAGPDLGL